MNSIMAIFRNVPFSPKLFPQVSHVYGRSFSCTVLSSPCMMYNKQMLDLFRYRVRWRSAIAAALGKRRKWDATTKSELKQRLPLVFKGIVALCKRCVAQVACKPPLSRLSSARPSRKSSFWPSSGGRRWCVWCPAGWLRTVGCRRWNRARLCLVKQKRHLQFWAAGGSYCTRAISSHAGWGDRKFTRSHRVCLKRVAVIHVGSLRLHWFSASFKYS